MSGNGEGRATINLSRRMRRLRRSASVRDLVRETRVGPEDLIAPVFVAEGIDRPVEVESMPGVWRHSLGSLAGEADALSAAGIRAVAVFPSIDPGRKSADGRHALDPDNLTCRAVAALKASHPDLSVIADVALDPFTTHGHDGVTDAGGAHVLNDETVDVLARMAVALADAGCDMVAPSDMMDGRVRAIRGALDGCGHAETLIMSYAAKFSSALYGPFREAVGSARGVGEPPLDKRGYQVEPANGRQALADALLDVDEGADILMVKPAGWYLDVLSALRAACRLPLAAYQISGEYAQIQAAAARGWLDREAARDESLLAIKRAGADLIVTYFAKEAALAARGG